MLNSDVTGLLVCFLSQGGFKGAFVSVDLSKEHADTSGQVNCVKKKKRHNFLNILSQSVAHWCFPGDEGRYLSVLHPFLSLPVAEWLEDNVLGFQALPENTGSPLSCF